MCRHACPHIARAQVMQIGAHKSDIRVKGPIPLQEARDTQRKSRERLCWWDGRLVIRDADKDDGVGRHSIHNAVDDALKQVFGESAMGTRVPSGWVVGCLVVTRGVVVIEEVSNTHVYPTEVGPILCQFNIDAAIFGYESDARLV